MNTIQIRSYTSGDYPSVKKLYKDSGWFDPETDAEERLKIKSERDAESLLVALERENIIGTLSLIEDGRIALFFRLIGTAEEIRNTLLKAGEEVFKKRGYKEVHIISLEEDHNRQSDYETYGFKKGNLYRWMWKKL